MRRIQSFLITSFLVAALASMGACTDQTIGTYNSPPQATITLPGPNAEIDATTVSFAGSVQDSEDPSEDLQVRWFDSLAADPTVPMCEGAPDASGYTTCSAVDMATGTHLITLQVVDTKGSSDEDNIEIEIVIISNPPLVDITAPASGSTYYPDDIINFSGQVQNADGTELSLPVVWRTDYTDPEGLQLQIDLLDNMLADGTGTTAFARDLPAGVHIITLTATDSLGVLGQDSTTVTVSDYPPGQLDLDNDGFCPDGIDANNDGHCDDTELDPNGDCNDNDSAIHPNAQEICDGIDNNCDDLLGDGEATPDETDADNDGVMVCEGDCDDTDNTNYPENEEICDGQDNDCNVATWADAAQEVDVDLDGYLSCVDCDDNNVEVNPAAEEICGDDMDNDCDGNVDSGFDLDGDGVPGDPCGEDCNDANSSIYPDAWDNCSDDVDSDCDGVVNDDGAGPYEMYETDLSSDGYDMSSLGPQLAVGTGTCGFTALGSDFHLAPGSGAVTGVFSSTEDVMDIYTIDTSFSGNTLVLAGFLLLDSLPVGCGEGEISWTANQPITVTADIDGQTYTSTGNTGSLPFSLALTEIFDIEYFIVVEPASSFVPTSDGQCTYDYTLNFEIP